MRKKFSLILFLLLLLVIFDTALLKCICEAKMRFPSHDSKLILENEPNIGEIVTIRLIKIAGYDDPNAKLGCFFSEGLELVNSREYKISFVAPPAALEKGFVAFFYSGPLKKGETKEAVFKVRIPDGKKYSVGQLEIDLGDPEPPEWNPEVKQEIKIVPKDETGAGGIRARAGVEKAEELSDLELSKEIPPPLRTEFKIRTKDRPSIEYWNLTPAPNEPLIIPLRYLVYSEEEASKVEVNLFLPEGIELVNNQGYQISQEEGKTKVLVYSGPMRFKECKAFYLQVQPQKRERFYLTAQTHLTNLKNEELFKEDSLGINLTPGKKL